MVVHTLSLLVALQAPSTEPAKPGVEGTVRAVEDGRLLARVLVEAPDEHRWTLSDSLGLYQLAKLPPGTHRLRFQVPGRVPLELTALVPASTTVRLDVELTQQPHELAPVVVLAPRPQGDAGAAARRQSEPLSSAWALRAAAAERDLESALMNGEAALSHGAQAGTLHFQGGSSDHILLTLDGFPVYGAKHFGASWSAINPDVVQAITLHTPASPSGDGGRLSGSVDVRTSLDGEGLHGEGAVTPGDVRQMVRVGLPGGRGSFLLSGRRSLRNFFTDRTLAERNGYDDWLGSTALPLGGGRLRLLLYRASNQLSFESRTDSTLTQGEVSSTEGEPPSSWNNLEWVSHTAGLAWEGTKGSRTLGLAAWQAGLQTSAQWLDPSLPLAISNHFVELGIRGRSTWRLGEGEATAGFSVRQLRSGYDAHAVTGLSPQPAGVNIASGPTVISGTIGRKWRPRDGASVEAGIRGDWASFGWGGTEPWLAVQVQPWRGLTLIAQAGRAYQFTQSWINDESFLTTLAGMEVPVAAGATGMPVARSDNLTAGAELRTGAGWTLGLEGYTRYLSNLFLIAPVSTQPFPSTSAGFGDGKAAGLILRSSLIRGPIEFAFSVGLTRASRTLGSVRYTPGFERSEFLHAATVVHVDPATTLGVLVNVGSGQPTTPLTAFDWQPYNPWNGNGELAGTPANLGGPINSYRLPPLRRVDVGLRREWRLGSESATMITTSLTLENLFNTPNAIGLIGAQTALRTEFLYAGSRALRLELGWGF